MTQLADSPSPRAEKLTEVRGHRIPKRRFTRWALCYFILYIVLPVLAVSLLADALAYFLFTRFTDHCYALFCLFS